MQISKNIYLTKNNPRKLLREIAELKNEQYEFIEWLENEIKECNAYSKYIERKLQELKSRNSSKTYIANEIMKNETAKECYEKVLSKYKKIIGG